MPLRSRLKRAIISIHALLAESDVGIPNANTDKKISIHALLAESDSATTSAKTRQSDFYPRSPCGERPPVFIFPRITGLISIHALLAESDAIGLKRV